MKFNSDRLYALESRYRAHLINSLSGYKNFIHVIGHH